MNQNFKTAHFRILKIRDVRRDHFGELHMMPTFIVQKRFLLFWWRTEKYWRHKNDTVGNWVTYKFDTEKEALKYINKTNYSTKVLWIVV